GRAAADGGRVTKFCAAAIRGRGARRHSGGHLQGRQLGLDPGAARLQERRQLERGAQRRLWLIDREAGPVGGDLEQDAARLEEIDRPEVLPVLLVRRLDV